MRFEIIGAFDANVCPGTNSNLINNVMALSNNILDRFKQILKSRVTINAAHVGKVIGLRITNATYGYYNEKQGFVQDIYNTNANSGLYLQSDDFKAAVRELVALDAAGDAKATEAKMNEILNIANISFNVINTGTGSQVQFGKGEMVNCPIAMITTKAGRESVIVDKPYAVKTETASKMDFDLDALMAPEVPGTATA